jgi:hypothetical protein
MNLLREEAQENVIKDELKEYDRQILKQCFKYDLCTSLEVSKMTILVSRAFNFTVLKCIFILKSKFMINVFLTYPLY